MISPHGWITLAVPGPDGRTTQWIIETSNPNGLMRLGWSKRSLKFGSSATRLREAFPRERRIEPRERRDGDAGGRAQGLRRLLRPALRNAMNGRRSPIAGRCATAAFFALLSARASFPLHAPAALPRLADGHPDLQGLWMKSAGGFQGLFIGSLNGTNFAAGGAWRAWRPTQSRGSRISVQRRRSGPTA